MSLVKSCFSLIALFFIFVTLLAVGFVLPQRLIDTGVEKYNGQEKEIDRAALGYAKAETESSEDAPFNALITAYHVERIGRCPGPPPSDPPDVCLKGCEPPPEASNDPEFKKLEQEARMPYFSMKVRTYTVFGLPYGDVSLGCNEQR